MAVEAKPVFEIGPPISSTPSRDSSGPISPTTVNAHDTLSIGGLLADSSLDNKTVMEGLATIILDANRDIKERTEAMSHLLNLSVTDPSPVLTPLLSNPHLPDSLCNQILDDSLNDSLSWQADAHLAVLIHREGKEIQAKAREHLSFLLGTDYAGSISEWTKAIESAKAKWAQPSN